MQMISCETKVVKLPKTGPFVLVVDDTVPC